MELNFHYINNRKNIETKQEKRKLLFERGLSNAVD